MTRLTTALADLAPERLRAMRRGVEKESLRVQPDGRLATTPHPAALGSPLTHPCITNDFSEAQPELVTGAHDRVEACEAELTQIHQVVYRALGDEMLWVASMPCGLPSDENIPIANFGTSNIGRAKSVYRMGLGMRYGRRMQTISGIHYNWSMPGLSNADYFGLIRNFRRHSFVLLTLFGASPAVCPSFVADRRHDLQRLSEHTLYLPHATSLRMGRLGYQSDAQAALAVSYNGLEDYVGSLHGAINRPHPPYQQVGIRGPDGEYLQLSDSLLQIENEFYGTIRPKRSIRRGERALHALRERGVEYVEVRCMDLDPFEPVGINADTMRVIDLFLLHCLLSHSPDDSPEEIARLARNQDLTAARGREPGLRLESADGDRPLIEWAQSLLGECSPIAGQVDRALGGTAYAAALEATLATLAQPRRLPSARVLETMARDFEQAYTDFVRAQSNHARATSLALPFPADLARHFEALAAQSLLDQQRLEADDRLPFEAYRQQYLAPERLGVD